MNDINKTDLNAVERDLIEGLTEFANDIAKENDCVGEKYNFRRVTLELAPHHYGAAEVKATRKLLHASQAIFAQLIGVSVKTVRAWEAGKTLGKMACRFLDEIKRNPKYWLKVLADATVVKDKAGRANPKVRPKMLDHSAKSVN